MSVIYRNLIMLSVGMRVRAGVFLSAPFQSLGVTVLPRPSAVHLNPSLSVPCFHAIFPHHPLCPPLSLLMRMRTLWRVCVRERDRRKSFNSLSDNHPNVK